MSFDTLPFALFAVVTFALWRVARAPAPNRLWAAAPGVLLLTASVVFYLFAGLRDLAVAGFLLMANHLMAAHVATSRGALAAIIGTNLATLAYFKYRWFLSGVVGFEGTLSGANVIPLGISFYVFQMCAYQVDIARGHTTPERHVGRFALFVTFFPQLIAGPIVRAAALLPQIRRCFDGRSTSLRAPTVALALICLGLVKKVVIADSLAPHVDAVFTAGPADAASAWLGAWLFSFQIYFDFSGYSDIAVGLGRLLGIRLPVNFRQPYLSASPQEFWRRWHITLSEWIRDYLYGPLGGRRGGAVRQAGVLLLVMGLAGLWHGASWNFIAWGLAWGVVIAAWRPLAGLARQVPWLARLTLLAVVTVLWVPFRAADLPATLAYLASMFGGSPGGTWQLPLEPWVLAGAAALIALHGLERLAYTRPFKRCLLRADGPFMWALLLSVAMWIVVLPKPNANAFIYFRF